TLFRSHGSRPLPCTTSSTARSRSTTSAASPRRAARCSTAPTWATAIPPSTCGMPRSRPSARPESTGSRCCGRSHRSRRSPATPGRCFFPRVIRCAPDRSPPPIWRPDMTESVEDAHRRVAGLRAPDLLSEARRLDAADPLAHHLAAFADAPGVVAYLDGNSLGRPLRDLPEKMSAFIRDDWGTRLIRSWDEQWMDLPMTVGDRIADVALGAGP